MQYTLSISHIEIIRYGDKIYKMLDFFESFVYNNGTNTVKGKRTTCYITL